MERRSQLSPRPTVLLPSRRFWRPCRRIYWKMIDKNEIRIAIVPAFSQHVVGQYYQSGLKLQVWTTRKNYSTSEGRERLIHTYRKRNVHKGYKIYSPSRGGIAGKD